jgi:hypothetical protein
MAIARAIAIGAAAALAVPYVMRDDPQALGGWIHRGVVNFSVSDYHFSWSWPLFSIVTLFAWGFLAWSDR